MIPDYLYLSIVGFTSLTFMGLILMYATTAIDLIKEVLPGAKKSSPMPDSHYEDPLRDLTHRIEMAENARKWYQHCVNKDNDEVALALSIMLKHSMQAVARFAVQEVRDGKVSKRPEEQRERIESLLESCRLALIENGLTEEAAEAAIKDGITFNLHSYEMSSAILPEGIISNPAEQYFEFRNNNFYGSFDSDAGF